MATVRSRKATISSGRRTAIYVVTSPTTPDASHFGMRPLTDERSSGAAERGALDLPVLRLTGACCGDALAQETIDLPAAHQRRQHAADPGHGRATTGQRTKSSRPPTARIAASVQSPTEIDR